MGAQTIYLRAESIDHARAINNPLDRGQNLNYAGLILLSRDFRFESPIATTLNPTQSSGAAFQGFPNGVRRTEFHGDNKESHIFFELGLRAQFCFRVSEVDRHG